PHAAGLPPDPGAPPGGAAAGRDRGPHRAARGQRPPHPPAAGPGAGPRRRTTREPGWGGMMTETQAPPAQSSRIERLAQGMVARWAAGERPPAEEYLPPFPEPRPPPRPPPQLIPPQPPPPQHPALPPP